MSQPDLLDRQDHGARQEAQQRVQPVDGLCYDVVTSRGSLGYTAAGGARALAELLRASRVRLQEVRADLQAPPESPSVLSAAALSFESPTAVVSRSAASSSSYGAEQPIATAVEFGDEVVPVADGIVATGEPDVQAIAVHVKFVRRTCLHQ